MITYSEIMRNVYCLEKAVYFLISQLEQLRSLLGNKECAQVMLFYRVKLFVLLDHAGAKSPVEFWNIDKNNC